MKKYLQTIFAVLFAFQLSAQTVVDVIVDSPDHTILEAAVLAADLAGTLSGPGPFTVFAPTDAAFQALPAGTVDDLLLDPSGALTDILLYHVLAANVLSTDLSDGMTATTINGKDVTVTINADGVFINDAQVTVADITTDNGVVHVIDAVLLPPVVTVVDVIVNSPDHNTLEAAVIAADLAGTLSGEGPFTVFAPTDAAFEALPAGTVDALLADPTGDLTKILLYHVLGTEVLSTDLSNGQLATTLNGQYINVTIDTDGVFINDAKVTVVDIITDNGVVHVIDAVLLPILSSTENVDFISFELYPNPSTDFVNIKLSNDLNEELNLEIYDQTGRLLNTNEKISATTIIDVSTYKEGVYFFQLRMGASLYTKCMLIK